MSSHNTDKQFRRILSSRGESSFNKAPSKLKSLIYSALIREQQKDGPLMSLDQTEAAGRGLCGWEKLMKAAPIGEKGREFFHCHTCHARLLAEHFEHVPISWAFCPYVEFQKR